MSKLLAWFKFHIELWRTMRAYARWDAVCRKNGYEQPRLEDFEDE